MATTTYSDLLAASTLHDGDVFAVDQHPDEKSKKISLAQAAEYVEGKVVTPAVAAEATRASGVESNLSDAVQSLENKKANLIKTPHIKTLAEAVVSDILGLITFDTSSSPGVPASVGSMVFSDNSRIDVDAAGEMKYTSAESVITDIYTGGIWRVSSLNTGTAAVASVSNNTGGAWEKGTWSAGIVTIDLVDVKQFAEAIKAKAGDNADLATTEKGTLVGAVNELVNTKLDKKTIYPDTSWEWFKPEIDGGGHWYWDFSTSTLRFEGFNNDSASAVVWERYMISGGGPNFQLSGGSRIGARLIVAWDGGARGVGTMRTYYTTGKADSSFTADDEITSQQWVRTLIAGETGKPLPAVADHDALLALTGMKVNDWVYVEDDTYTPEGESDPIHVGETWAYAYDGSAWVELVRINEVQTQDDDITLEIDSVSGKRQVKAGGIGTTQLASGAAADNVIGNRQVEDNPASDVLPEADTGFTLAQWLQKIRDNLKFALSKFIAKVDGVEPNASRNVQVLRRITLAEAQALIDDPTQAEPGVKYYVPETGDLLIERPDYANQETINRITTNNGSWTVDRPGYVNAQVYNGNVTATRSIFINDKLVMRNGPPYSDAWGVYQVSKGDVIILSSGSTTGFSCSCYFIPSKFSIIKNPTLVVEPGSDYSYDEQPVMIQLPDGTVRQKLTEKGNPLFRRTFTFSFTTAASTERVQKWQTSGIFLKRVVEGWWVNTSEPFAKNPIGVITIVNPDPTNTTQFSTYFDCLSGGTARLWWSNSYNGLFNVTIQGHVTLEYTKVYESE